MTAPGKETMWKMSSTRAERWDAERSDVAETEAEPVSDRGAGVGWGGHC